VPPEPGQVQAAVLIMLFERNDEPWMVFTKRSEAVRHHKGEISFPGGMRDPGDDSLIATAIRETVEELGADPKDIDVLGALDELPTFSTNFVVAPFEALTNDREYSHFEPEVAEVIRVPVAELSRIGREAVWESNGHEFATHVFEVGSHVIWGATGRILRDFLDVAGDALGLVKGER
jgi:8-oxo-dGTP pyrophosphatase MutT (NUDIX family)